MGNKQSAFGHFVTILWTLTVFVFVDFIWQFQGLPFELNISRHQQVIIFVILFIISAILSAVWKRKKEKFHLREAILQSIKTEIQKTRESFPPANQNPPDQYLPREPRYDDTLVNYLLATITGDGFVELQITKFDTDLPLRQIQEHTLYLHLVEPGMHKTFMVLCNENEENTYFIVQSPDDYYSRDFAMTWFDVIIPILGNSTKSISKKQTGSSMGEFHPDFYIIKKYFFKKKFKKLYLRIPLE